MSDPMQKDEMCKGCYYEERSYTVDPCKECSRAFSGMQRDWHEPRITATPSEFKQFLPGGIVYIDKLPKKESEEEFLTKLIDDHWAYIEALMKAHNEDGWLQIVRFHYKSAFRHGFKHALEWVEEGK